MVFIETSLNPLRWTRNKRNSHVPSICTLFKSQVIIEQKKLHHINAFTTVEFLIVAMARIYNLLEIFLMKAALESFNKSFNFSGKWEKMHCYFWQNSAQLAPLKSCFSKLYSLKLYFDQVYFYEATQDCPQIRSHSLLPPSTIILRVSKIIKTIDE